MLGSLLSSVGGKIGQYFGGGILSTIGRYAGKQLGKYLQQKWFHKKQTFHKYANIKESFSLSTATYGAAIPLIFGKARVRGKIIWTNDVKNEESTSSSSTYFPKTGILPLPKVKRSTTYKTDYDYYLSFAMCICEGEISEINRIWNGDELVDISNYKFRLYKGKQDQMPDPIINAQMEGKAPAFRDLAYIVFEDLPLRDFDDMIPNLSFEITRKPNIPHSNMVEDMVESMIMIPGSGEYVYDTILQYKEILVENNSVISKKLLNSHNIYNLPNSIQSLNQLSNVCENIKWIAPVVCWFANSMDLKECLIRPAVEFKDEYVRFSEEWEVGNYNRENAYEIRKDKENNPIYGGSINDNSIIRYLTELKKRKFNIMFYPMFFMDVDMKPWRGHLTGNFKNVENFFNKKYGYNEFILHYANLVKHHVDAFIIGSELIGLTKIKDSNNNFPAVHELIKLAAKVKQIVGPKVLVSYAADWSEFHHTDGGWYNLDPLWASKNIDFIGIDAYFPITNTENSGITDKEIEVGFSSGECYDYYIDWKTKEKHPLEAKYALKNIKYWWNNKHQNPDKKFTPWEPKSKKIWFTEFGFPSINKAPNQPNVFFDPVCSDGGAPRYSNGEVDFSIQRRCIRAFIEYWSKEEYIDNLFLWTWDARPYPAWPHMDIWKDGNLWEKGHWVNNKFGICSIAGIILEISKRCRLNLENIEVKNIDEVIEGVIFNNQTTGTDAINTLRSSYFFDISASKNQKITFMKRGQSKPIKINAEDLVKLSDNSYINETIISKEQIVSKIDIYFQNQLQDYMTNYLYVNSENISNKQNVSLHLPFVISSEEASRIAHMILKNAATENKILQFKLPISYFDIESTDFISLKYHGINYHLRIVRIIFSNLVMEIMAVIDNISNYHNNYINKVKLDLNHQENIETEFVAINLPLLQQNYDFPYILVHLNNNKKLALEAKVNNDISNDWHKIAMLEPTNAIVNIIEINHFDDPNFFIIDEISTIKITGPKLDQLPNNKWYLAKIDDEIVSFRNIQKLKENIYLLSNFIRGCYGTEKQAKNHNADSLFIILENANIIPIAENLIGQEIKFKVQNLRQNIIVQDNSNFKTVPIITENYIQDSSLHLKWLVKNFKLDGWTQINKNPEKYEIKITANKQTYYFESQKGINKMSIDISKLNIKKNYLITIKSID